MAPTPFIISRPPPYHPRFTAIGSSCCSVAHFFRRLIFHWEAAGLGEWLSREGSVLKRRISQASLGHPDLSIVLGEYNRGDAIAFESRQIAVVPNGIPDPCPNFEVELKTSREARRLRRVQILAGPRQ
jgi:hypothetical protein